MVWIRINEFIFDEILLVQEMYYRFDGPQGTAADIVGGTGSCQEETTNEISVISLVKLSIQHATFIHNADMPIVAFDLNSADECPTCTLIVHSAHAHSVDIPTRRTRRIF